MTKQEFLSRLEDLLSDLPTEEREDALRFYQEYLEDAGEENEQTALAELGDVEQLAEQIRQACCTNKAEQPQQPEPQQPQPPKPQPEQRRWPAPVQYLRPNSSDYTEYRQTRAEGSASYTTPASDYTQAKKKPNQDTPNTATIVILILIAIVTFPVWIGIVGTIFGLFVGFGIAAIVCIVCAVVGLFSIPSVGMGGLLVFGGCTIVAGISLIIAGGIGWLVVRFGAPLLQFIVKCVKKLVSAVNA